MSKKVPITVAEGDGIGPEIMLNTLLLLKEAGADLEIEKIEIGEKVYLGGNTSGIEKSSWESLRRTKVFLKSPITTPQGGGYKSLNVTIRKSLGLYANVRPCVSYYPYIKTNFPGMNVIIIRENEEDLYAGIEHRQTNDVYQCLKLISRPGSEKLIKFAFDYADNYKRKKISCFTKDNIMKMTDGIFHKIFDELGQEYPNLEKKHMIIDIGSAKLAKSPCDFDVIVAPNLYGDIISDIAAEVSGSVGLAGSANYGDHCSMFEAIHGSAPDISGKNIANPSGLIQSAIMMLAHINQSEVAQLINNAWLKTIEDGIHTNDIYNPETSTQLVGTNEFTSAVIKRLGQKPEIFNGTIYQRFTSKSNTIKKARIQEKELVGVDVFFDWKGNNPNILAEILQDIGNKNLQLKMITNRGVKVWPDGFPETFCVDHWRARFVSIHPEKSINHLEVIQLLSQIENKNLDFIKIENLYTFDGEKGYSLGQGE
ncbi:MAG: NADP-dependent isocitrate dehydrogenase [Candidatus Sericytochromatia bacterium]|nr:NADP-dependent isocitrate dehydrogenase [Candidatus Sericytochromatia bacterium]